MQWADWAGLHALCVHKRDGQALLPMWEKLPNTAFPGPLPNLRQAQGWLCVMI